jgi:hypothetical protein
MIILFPSKAFNVYYWFSLKLKVVKKYTLDWEYSELAKDYCGLYFTTNKNPSSQYLLVHIENQLFSYKCDLKDFTMEEGFRLTVNDDSLDIGSDVEQIFILPYTTNNNIIYPQSQIWMKTNITEVVNYNNDLYIAADTIIYLNLSDLQPTQNNTTKTLFPHKNIWVTINKDQNLNSKLHQNPDIYELRSIGNIKGIRAGMLGWFTVAEVGDKVKLR